MAGEELRYLVDEGVEVSRVDVGVGVGGRSAVHQDVGNLQVADSMIHFCVQLTAADVVYHVCTGFDGYACRKAVAGVDGKNGFG